MNDMQAIAKILVVFRESEKIGAVNMCLLDEKSLRVTERERDALVIALLHAGLIEGVATTEDVDNASDEVLWNLSRPRVTLAGIEYMSTDSNFKKAARDIAMTEGQTLLGALCSRFAQ